MGGGIAVYGEYFLTTVYPTSVTGAHGYNGDKSIKEDVILSRNG